MMTVMNSAAASGRGERSAGVVVTAVRDFRVVGAPVGYVMVWGRDYYAWWNHQHAGVLHIQRADRPDEAVMDFGFGAEVCLADGGELTGKVEEAVGLEPIENWGGRYEPLPEYVLRLRLEDGLGEQQVRFFSDRIETKICWGIALDGVVGVRMGSGTRLFGRVAPGNPESHGVGLHPPERSQWIRADWFTPPPFAFAIEGGGGWYCAGLEDRPGEMSYRRFGWLGDRRCWEIGYEPATTLAEGALSPCLVFRFGADAPEDAWARHARGSRQKAGLLEAGYRVLPDWWRGPMVCGWHEQVRVGKERFDGNANAACREDVYNDWVSAMDAAGLEWEMLTIDAGWSEEDGRWVPDREKWPDLAGWIRRCHERGRRVLLWVSTNAFGLPEDEVLHAGGRAWLDPSNPRWQARLRRHCELMLGTDGLGADGLKFDYTDQIPREVASDACEPLVGLDYLWALFREVHGASKAVRSDALMDFQVAHPLFSGFVDMVRLNDFFLPPGLAAQTMGWRSRIARATCPGCLVDTDGPVGEEWFREAWRYGNPSFYVTNQDLSDARLVDAMKAGIAATRGNVVLR